MEARLITTADEFLKLQKDWKRLQEQDDDVSYYSTFEYNWTWWDVYKSDKNKSLFIIVVESNKTVIGIAPLIIEKVDKKFFTYRDLKFLGRGDYLDIIIDQSSVIKYKTTIKEMLDFIELKNKYYDRVTLTHIKHNSKLSSYMLRNEKYNNNYKYLIECPILIYKKFNNFEVYKNEFLGLSAKRYYKKLQREVGYKFRVVFNDSENVYEEISKLHINEQNYLATKKGRKERSSLYNDRLYSEFVRKIYNNNSKVITFVIENLEGKLLVYNTCYLYKKVLYAWNMAYDHDYEKYSLFKVLSAEISKFAFESNIADAFDFGAGRYPWKFEWTNDFIFDYKFDIWNIKTRKGMILKKIYNIKNKFKSS